MTQFRTRARSLISPVRGRMKFLPDTACEMGRTSNCKIVHDTVCRFIDAPTERVLRCHAV